GGMRPLMQTDSEQLMHQGIAAGAETFADFLKECGWSKHQLTKTICHQVGLSHRKLMLQALGIDSAIDFTSVETLGNTGSVALPITLARAVKHGHLQPKDHLGLLGIGSGINVLMIGVEWQAAWKPLQRVDAPSSNVPAPVREKRPATTP